MSKLPNHAHTVNGDAFRMKNGGTPNRVQSLRESKQYTSTKSQREFRAWLKDQSEIKPQHRFFYGNDDIQMTLKNKLFNADLYLHESTLRVKEKPKALIDVHSTPYRVFEFIILIATLWVAIVTPFEVSFLPGEVEVNVLFFINLVVDFIFILDIVATFNTPIQDEDTGLIITDRTKIAKQYFKTWFFIDFIPVIPYDLILLLISSGNNENLGSIRFLRIIRVLKLLKILRVLKLSVLYREFHDSIPLKHTTVTLLRFVCMMLFLSHWVACILRLVPELHHIGTDVVLEFEDPDTYFGPTNWIDRYFVENLGLEYGEFGITSIYIAALYYAVMTLTTVGFGDVSAFTDLERAFMVALMLIGALTYSYIIGSVCAIFANIHEKNSEFFEKFDELKDYMRRENIPLELRSKIKHYYHASEAQREFEQYKILVKSLSYPLQKEISNFRNQGLLKHVSLVQFSPADEQKDFMLAISVNLKLEVFSPFEKIVSRNDLVNKLFIVKKGMILLHQRDKIELDMEDILEVTDRDEDSVLQGRLYYRDSSLQAMCCEDNISFGQEIGLVDDFYSQYNATTLSFCEVYILSKADLHEVMRAHQFNDTEQSIKAAIQKMVDANIIANTSHISPQ
eukprot:maker-scaffold_13-snap-gene-8.4-mRNA-1 protein AED:0.00 eAED:0.00 QI:61/1/1/1/1/1/2/317/622